MLPYIGSLSNTIWRIFFSRQGVLLGADKQRTINNELTQTDVEGLHASDGQVVEENLVPLSPPRAIA